MKKILIFTIIAMTVLAGCKTSVDLSGQVDTATASSGFRGEKGLFVPMDSNGVSIEAASVSDGKAHFFNTTLPNGDPVYFFVVKSPDGKLRAAANGCQICGSALQGFRQSGDYMVCNTCGNSYPLNKIATEKGGCNPAPINPDLKAENGIVKISTSELQNVLQYLT